MRRRSPAAAVGRVAILGFLGAVGMLLAPEARQASARGPTLSVSSALLADARTGEWLYGVSPNSRHAIASTTKMMTALITLEHARLHRVFSYPGYYFPPIDTQIGLAPGERMTVADLLRATLLPSADDAAADLAYNVGRRSQARFVGMMNARARQLHLRHTHYSTPTGLDSPGNYSSASDLLKLARYDLDTQPFFARTVARAGAVLGSGNHRRFVINRNDLVARFGWIKGVKSGHTSQAGYVLVALGVRNGMRLLSVVLGTSSPGARDGNTLALLGYGFSAFRSATPVRRGEILAHRGVVGRAGMRVGIRAASSLTRVVARHARVWLRLRLPTSLRGPRAAGSTVGSATAFAGRERLGRVRLTLATAIPGPARRGRVSRLALVVLPFAALAGLFTRRRRGAEDSAPEGVPT